MLVSGLLGDHRAVSDSAVIGVVHHPSIGAPFPGGCLQSAQDQLGPQVLGHGSSDNATAEGIERHREVKEAPPRSTPI